MSQKQKLPQTISLRHIRQIVDLPLGQLDSIMRDLKKGYDVKDCPAMPDHLRGQLGWMKAGMFSVGGGSDLHLSVKLVQWLIDNKAFPLKQSDSPIQKRFLSEILDGHGLRQHETML